MNTGTKLALTGAAFITSLMSLPAVAAPNFYLATDFPLVVAARGNADFEDERNTRQSKKIRKEERREDRRNERAHESDEPGYGYGYERRYPVQPNPGDRARR